MNARLRTARKSASDLAARLQALHPAARLAAQQRRAHDVDLRLRRAGERLLDARRDDLREATQGLERLALEGTTERREALAMAAARLHALSPLAILARGYALVTTGDGRAVRSAADAPVGATVRVRAAEAQFDATIVRAIDKETP